MDSGENRVMHGGWVFEPISAPVLAASVASPPHPIAAACRASVPTFRVTFPSFKVSTFMFVDLTFPHFDNFCGLALILQRWGPRCLVWWMETMGSDAKRTM